MTVAIKNTLCAVAAAFILCLAPCALADTTATLTLTSAGNNVMDGVYVGPYYANITSGGVTQYNQQVICDDFKDDSYVGHTWTATVNTFADLSHTLWGAQILSQPGGTMAQVTQLYNEAAWLAVTMMSLPSSQQGLYSFAIWAIFSPDAVKNVVTANEWTAISGLISTAKSQKFSPGQFANFLIYTPLNKPGVSCVVGSCPAQEFFVIQTPEGGAALLYLLFAGLACMVAMRFRVRQALPGKRMA